MPDPTTTNDHIILSGAREFEISNSRGAIEVLGEPRLARRLAYIEIRDPDHPEGGCEVITTSQGLQEARKGVQYVAIDSQGEYPYDIEAFRINMEPVPGQEGKYRKKTLSQLIAIPEGITIFCVTIDQGSQEPSIVRHPDFIGIGRKNIGTEQEPLYEVYPVSKDVVEREFEWVD